MRLLLGLLVALAAVPAAFADDHPAPAAVAACQAEAAQLGKDAFVAKYGPSEPFGHCYAAHAGAPATTTTTATPPAPAPHDPPAVAACKAEAAQLGKDAFAAKYGGNEALGHCAAAHTPAPPTTTTTATPPAPHDPPAVAGCKAEAAQLGKDAFAAKYGGSEALGHCVAAQCAAQGKKLGKDAFTEKYGDKNPLAACVKAATKPKR